MKSKFETFQRFSHKPYIPLLLALLADLFFFKHTLGWTVSAYGIVLGCVLLLRARPRFYPPMQKVLFLLMIPALALLWRIDWVTIVVLVFFVWALSVTAGGGAPATLAGWPMAFLRFPLRFLQYLERRISHGGGVGNRGCNKTNRKIFRNWFIPIALTLVFVVLFSIANPVFSDWTRSLLRWGQVQFYDWLNPLRWFFWGLVSSLCWCLIRYRAKRGGTSPTSFVKRRTNTEPIIPLGRTLGLFNLVFAIQNLLDVRYLLYGAELPTGMTYASYAHRGAYPLVATALLAGAFILIVFPPGRDKADSRLVHGLLYGWIIQNVILTIAAAWRLWLYVGAYGLTRLRVAAAFWIMLVAAGLLLAGVRICLRYSTDWLVKANVLALSGVLAIWMFADVHGVVAQFNVQHCRERNGAGVSIDLDYLQELGPAALPALAVLAETDLPTNLSVRVQRTITILEMRLDQQLDDWRGWTIQRFLLANWKHDKR